MIRVNLLKNRGEATRGGTTGVNFETQVNEATEFGVGAGDPKDFGLKIFVLLITIGCLFGYETYNRNRLQSEIGAITAKNSGIAQEISAKTVEADKAKALKNQILDLEARIKAIKTLSKIRLREIKAIDFIQNVIPERVWLTLLDFEGENLKIEGGSATDDELNKFMESLESKSFFKNVIMLKAVEQKAQEGTIKVFQISSSLVGSD